MVYLKNVNWANEVFWTSEAAFDVPRQIAAVKKPETSEDKHDPHTVGVVTDILRFWLEVLAAGPHLRLFGFVSYHHATGGQDAGAD